MKVQLIRNATMKITYNGHTFLTDPMLSAKGELPSFAGIAKNPTVELPLPIEEIFKDVESIFVTHLHPDHFDSAASFILPKALPIFCQQGDQEHFVEEGFLDVLPIDTSGIWNGITISRTAGQHGTGKILEKMGKISGFVFQADGEPTVYWVGDSIWCEEVEDAIKMFSPDIIITHSGGATIPGFDAIIMDGEQTIKVIGSCPKAIIVAIHMESLDHCAIDRKTLRQIADNAKIEPSRLKIPGNGETLIF